MPKQIVIPPSEEKIRYKGIENINYTPGSHLTLTIQMGDIIDGNLVFDMSITPEYQTIAGQAYSELLSANPSWAPDKPEGYYREDDLWHIIDEIEAGNLASEFT